MKILTVFAHPDDETMLSGGTLALLNRGGAEIHYVCATRGEGGELGQPPVASREQISFYRELELVRAVQALGGGKLTFLDHVDPLVGENQELFPYTDDLNQLISQIAHLIGTYQPEVIITHGSNGEYGHPAHILTHKGVRKAVEDLRHSAPLLYTFCADFPGHPRPRHANPDDPAHLILDVRPAMAQKTRAAYCHRSQHALFLRRRSQKAGYRLTIPEILLDLESLHRVYPPVGGEPQDAVITALAPWKKTPQETMLYS